MEQPIISIVPIATSSVEKKTPYVTYETIKLENVLLGAAEKKEIPNMKGQHYYSCAFDYNYGTAEKSLEGKFFLEGPELYSATGINSKESKPNENGTGGGGMYHYIYTVLNQTNPEVKKFTEVLEELYFMIAEGIQGRCPSAASVFRHYDPAKPQALFAELTPRPTDKLTGKPMPHKDPIMYVKLFKRGVGSSGSKTLFTRPDIKRTPIPWELLNNTEMRFIPLFVIESVYIGTKISIQMKLKSAVVTAATRNGLDSIQLETVIRLNTERPDLAKEFEVQIAKLKELEKENSGQEKEVPEVKEETNESQVVPFTPKSLSTPRLRKLNQPQQP